MLNINTLQFGPNSYFSSLLVWWKWGYLSSPFWYHPHKCTINIDYLIVLLHTLWSDCIAFDRYMVCVCPLLLLIRCNYFVNIIINVTHWTTDGLTRLFVNIHTLECMLRSVYKRQHYRLHNQLLLVIHFVVLVNEMNVRTSNIVCLQFKILLQIDWISTFSSSSSFFIYVYSKILTCTL